MKELYVLSRQLDRFGDSSNTSFTIPFMFLHFLATADDEEKNDLCDSFEEETGQSYYPLIGIPYMPTDTWDLIFQKLDENGFHAILEEEGSTGFHLPGLRKECVQAIKNLETPEDEFDFGEED